MRKVDERSKQLVQDPLVNCHEMVCALIFPIDIMYTCLDTVKQTHKTPFTP